MMKLSDRLPIGLLLFLLVFLLKLPILNAPHHWDTIRIEIKTAIWLVENNFNPLFGEIGWGHPPLLFELIALTFKIFGINVWAPHLLILIFSFLAVYFTFLLGSEIFDKKTGFISSLLLFFSPLFFAQSGIVQIAVPFTALAIMTTYFLLKKNPLAYLVCGTALVMTKEPGILIVLLAMIYMARVRKSRPRDILLHASPLFIFLLWTLSNKLLHGWFLYPESVGYFGVKKLLPHLAYNAYLIFIGDFRWLVTLPAIIYIYKKIDARSVLLLAIVSSYWLFYSFMDVGMLPRYFLVTQPFLFILGAAGIVGKFGDKWKLILPVILFIFVLEWTGDRTDECGCTLETNLEYLDLIDTHLAASGFIENNYPNAVVLTTWPQGDELTRVYEGYVNRQIDVRLAYDNPDLSEVGLVYYSPQAHRPETLKRIMGQMNLTLLERFEKNGKYAEVYEVS